MKNRKIMIMFAKNSFLKSCLLPKVMRASWCPELLLNYYNTSLKNVAPRCSVMPLCFKFCYFFPEYNIVLLLWSAIRQNNWVEKCVCHVGNSFCVFCQGGMGAALLSDPDKIESVSITWWGWSCLGRNWALCSTGSRNELHRQQIRVQLSGLLSLGQWS